MNMIDKNYLSLQFWRRIYQKNATEFQSFFEDIMEKAFSDFQKIRPYGSKGDGGNDGYRPRAGMYYQVYAPKDPHEKEAAAAKKLKEDFNKLLANWDQISLVKTFNFVFNDKGAGVSIDIERVLAELRAANQHIEFKIFTPKNLEEIFFQLNTEQILSLGFDVNATNAVRMACDALSAFEVDLDRDNGKFILKALERLRDIIFGLNDEMLQLEYEIIECRTFQKLEKIKEAKQRYENICKRYPDDPRAFLYLAEIYLNDGDVEKNDELLNEAQKIDSTHWLLSLEKLIRVYQLEDQIDVASIDERRFPTDPKIKSNFYRLYSLLLERAGDQGRAISFIERAIKLNPDKISNHLVKLIILQNQLFAQNTEEEKMQEDASHLLSEIDAVQRKINDWGEVSLRNQATLNIIRINAFRAQQNHFEIENLAKQSFELLMQCYFDRSIDNLFTSLLGFIEVPPNDFERLLRYLQVAEKKISDDLAKLIVLQFIIKETLFDNGEKFFVAINKRDILDFICSLKNKKYDDAFIFLKDDLRFAVAIANTAKQFSELRRKIIENLPNDGNVQKEKLLLLLNYDEDKTDEAFELLKNLDLANLRYFECKPILKIAQDKKAWDFVVKILEKLLQYEKDKHIILQLKLSLFSANLKLKSFLEASRLGEKILSDPDLLALLDDHSKETLLGQTIVARLQRGEDQKAKDILEKYLNFSPSFEFKVEVEVAVYIRNNDAPKALSAVVAGVKTLKTPTPEQYGRLFIVFGEIGNLMDFFPITSQATIRADCFVKLKDRERWYFVGDKDELDATKVPLLDKKATAFLGKKIEENVVFEDKYSSSVSEHPVENILSIEKYIAWQSTHHAQQLTREHRWDMMEMIEVPTTGETIDTRYIIARLEDNRKKGADFFDLYCRENLPLAFLAINEGSLAGAIGRIKNENRGFVKFSSGELTEIDRQKEVAKRIISGEPCYIDGTSALVLSESGLLLDFYTYLPNLRVPQTVINLLLELKEKFRYVPGQVGHMGYAQGKLIFSSIDENTRASIQRNLDDCVRVLESKPLNIGAISAANKENCFSEQKVPAELCDACILAQKEATLILTEDFLYLQANELETKKKAPEYCSAFALTRVLYEQKKITFDKYLNFFAYLSSYRFRFLTLDTEDIEKAVLGDEVLKAVHPERIRQFNFPLTLSEQYGVSFETAFTVVGRFLIKVLIDDSIIPQIAERIFAEILSAFPTNQDKRVLGKLLLRVSVQIINKQSQGIIVGVRVKEKIALMSQVAEIFNAGDIWKPWQ